MFFFIFGQFQWILPYDPELNVAARHLFDKTYKHSSNGHRNNVLCTYFYVYYCYFILKPFKWFLHCARQPGDRDEFISITNSVNIIIQVQLKEKIELNLFLYVKIHIAVWGFGEIYIIKIRMIYDPNAQNLMVW